MLSESRSNDFQDKRLRGSGGYVLARITEEEQKKGNLGGPELFLAGIGRLDENRLLKYYCNKCEEQFDGPPSIIYDNPNEDLGEGVILEEKGEYKCKKCKSTIAQYRKFRAPQTEKQDQSNSSSVEPPEIRQQTPSTRPEQSPTAVERSASGSSHEVSTALTKGEFLPIQSLIEMPAYDIEAMLIGKIKEIGLRRQLNGNVQVSIMVQDQRKEKEAEPTEILWPNISKIGDIVLINESRLNRETDLSGKSAQPEKCRSCGYVNEDGAKYCEECGSKL
jgi:sporulation protein YlmC with PRC-barrel domain